ncbi:hypothetical protein SAMN04489761_0610 [Tenacibaculum sp. MAR_2009_124]|uniref:hypothetical protein n=1 Tax=Tenacibaculum sp. MAR_2009_124 TaxID=1250059 RepID=UPI0008966402|nr:hypothetical protein [Tenacibaculum sp. MAR_2009_124]SEB42142.1 hypothetical protein SAMN04489761_0610 [Tenacibaculum sp. MAR_2009_124]
MNKLKLKLTKIDPVKYALITASLMALIAFVMIGVITLFGSIFGALGAGASSELGPLAMIMGGGIFALILFPIIYFVFGFIIGIIGTMIFNFVLKKAGGLDLEFEKTGVEISTIGQE